MTRPTRLRLTFPEGGVTALADLLWKEAPRTCRTVVEGLPFAGTARHGIFSGYEVYLLVPPELRVERENATSRVLPGDLAFYAAPGGMHGQPEPISEILWFYDRFARPSMPDGPVAVNVFGRFRDGWDEFAELCRSMQTEGAQPLRIEAGD